MKRIGLALGGGGARGLAHIRFLEEMDELQVQPAAIAGCSMGAIMGALYAAGQSGAEIRQLVERYDLFERAPLRRAFRKILAIFKALERSGLRFGRSGLVDIDRLLQHLLEPIAGKTFADLEIPLTIVATDFWRAEEVVIEEGDLMTAIRASISIPGLVSPCKWGGRILVDGGLVNELPYSHLLDRCDATIAINVAGARAPENEETPSSLEASAGAIDILQKTLLHERLRQRSPDLLVCPAIRNVELLDFAKVQDIFAQCDPSLADFRSSLESLVDGRVPPPLK